MEIGLSSVKLYACAVTYVENKTLTFIYNGSFHTDEDAKEQAAQSICDVAVAKLSGSQIRERKENETALEYYKDVLIPSNPQLPVYAQYHVDIRPFTLAPEDSNRRRSRMVRNIP